MTHRGQIRFLSIRVPSGRLWFTATLTSQPALHPKQTHTENTTASVWWQLVGLHTCCIWLLHTTSVFDYNISVDLNVRLPYSKKDELEITMTSILMLNSLCVCVCVRTEYIMPCMLLTAYLPRIVKEGRWTDPLNKMSPPNTTMINHTLQIISTCMNERRSKALSPTVWLHAFTLSDSHRPGPPQPPQAPSLLADPSAPLTRTKRKSAWKEITHHVHKRPFWLKLSMKW